jgi:hypothetical protein
MAGPAPKKPAPAREVGIVTPDGSTFLVPASEVQAAVQRGARLETPEEQRQREVEDRQQGGEVRTAIEGGLRGLTMGLSDIPLAIGGEAEGASERREAFPTLSTGSEIAGGLLGMIPTGGAGAAAGAAKGGLTVGKAAKGTLGVLGAPTRATMALGKAAERGAERLLAPLAAKGAAGRIAAKGLSVGAGAATEGSLVGLGQFVSEAALGEVDPNAEALLDHVGAGAILGGAFGGALGAGGKMLGEGLDALRTSLPRVQGASVRKVFAKGAGQALGLPEDVVDAVLAGRANLAEAAAAPERMGAELATLRDEMDEAFDAVSLTHKGKIKRGFEGQVIPEAKRQDLTEAMLGLGEDTPGVLRSLEADLAAARNAGKGSFSGQGQLTDLDNILGAKIEAISKAGTAADIVGELDDFKRSIAGIRRKFAGITQDTAESIKTKELLDGAYAQIRDTLQDPDLVGETFAKAQTEINSEFAHLLELQGAQATSGLVKMHGKRQFLTPEAVERGEIVFRADPKGMENFVRGLGEDPNSVTLARELVEARAHRQLATMRAMARNYDLAPELLAKVDRAEQLVQRLDGMIAEGETFGQLRKAEAAVNRASAGTGLNVASGAVAGGLLGGPLGAAAGGLLGAVFSPVKAARQLATLERVLGAQRLRIVEGVGEYVRKAGRAAKKGVRHGGPAAVVRARSARDRDARVKAYRRELDDLAGMRSNPEALQDRVLRGTADFSAGAPGHAQAVVSKAAQVASYLYDRAPKPVTPPAPFTRSDRWAPSDTEIAKYERIRSVALQPSQILESLKAGTITQEEVAAVRDLHPNVYRQIVSEMTDRLSELREDLPYDERLRLSVLFGVPVEPGAAPQSIAAWQRAHAEIRGAQAQVQQAQQASARGLASIKPKAEMTESQRLESKALA